ncbi:MAG: cell division ATP-binding protein FtsE [bacterium]|nr:cell division ATP-binding protein FtsE [bacterium]
MIEFRYLTKTYDRGIRALNNITLKIERGEFVFLVGLSGAGKTTFLRMIYADERPTSGFVYVSSKDVGNIPNRNIPYLRRQIGIVFQDFKLLYSKTVFENVAFALRVIGTKEAEVYKRTIKALNIVELTQKKSCFPHELSGGEQQRVAIARAIINDPPILLSDEPTGNLDAQLTNGIINLFLNANEQGTTVIIATHDLELARRYGGRVIHIANGEIIQ